MERATEVKVGDKVAMKTGSPPMTVVEIYEQSEGVRSARCVWFDFASSNRMAEQVIPVAALGPA